MTRPVEQGAHAARQRLDDGRAPASRLRLAFDDAAIVAGERDLVALGEPTDARR